MPAVQNPEPRLGRWLGRRPESSSMDWVPVALVALTTLGMLLSSPVWAAPDAPMQQITAWYDIHHLLPTSGTLVPLDGSIVPCFAHRVATAASCTLQYPVPLPQVLAIPTLNYPPLGFWVIGVGQLLGTALGATSASTAGRLLLALSCVVVVLVAGRVLIAAQQRSALWMLPIAVTPMAAFLFAGSNVNGLEIAVAALFVALLFRWRHEHDDGRLRPRTELLLALGALALAACKPGDGLWIALLAGAAVVRWRRHLHPRALLRLLAACVPGIVLSVVWSLTHPTVITLDGVAGFHPGPPLGWATRIERAIPHLPDVAMQAWGVLGWLDTSPGRHFFVALGIGTAWFVLRTITTTSDRLFLGASVLLVASVAVAGDAVEWSSWPFWWQGRYSLPLIMGLALLLVSDGTPRPRPGMMAWAGFSSVAAATMVLLAYLRFAAGLVGPFHPVSLEPMLHDPLRTAGVLAIAVLLAATGLWLMGIDRRGADRHTAERIAAGT